MKQQLMQVQKQKSFQDICPQWYGYLLGIEDNQDEIKVTLSIGSRERCIVGEAYNFSNDYGKNGLRECSDCINHSYDFSDIYCANLIHTLHEKIGEFVNHWNNVHS